LRIVQSQKCVLIRVKNANSDKTVTRDKSAAVTMTAVVIGIAIMESVNAMDSKEAMSAQIETPLETIGATINARRGQQKHRQLTYPLSLLRLRQSSGALTEKAKERLGSMRTGTRIGSTKVLAII
jgi:hypothetical protein